MKLVRYGPVGKEKPGLIDADGKLRDLSRKVKDIDGVSLAPASLTRSIGQVRAKLADHYRTTIEELAERSEQLELVRGDLTKQLTTLQAKQAELDAWAERRHVDIETQASRLVSREQELDRQQQHYEQLESQWHIERTDYQAEIRRLLSSIRDLEIEEMRAA